MQTNNKIIKQKKKKTLRLKYEQKTTLKNNALIPFNLISADIQIKTFEYINFTSVDAKRLRLRMRYINRYCSPHTENAIVTVTCIFNADYFLVLERLLTTYNSLFLEFMKFSVFSRINFNKI